MKYWLFRASAIRLILPLPFILPLLLIWPLSAAPVRVINEWKHAVSAPLRDMVFRQFSGELGGDPDEEEPVFEGPTRVVKQTDTALQVKPGGQIGTIPGLNLLGLGAGFTGPQGAFQFAFAPPDPNSAVGATQVVETVNLSFAVFDKTTGATILGPIPIASLWNGFNSSCSSTVGLSLADPIVLYDKLAARWVMKIGTLSDPYFLCVAVSTTSDATGTWNQYAFSVPAEGRQSGEKMGLWSDGYYIAQWTYTTSTTYVGPEACVMNRTAMLAGQAATMQCIQINQTNIYGMLPSDLDGNNAPPSGAPNFFMIQGPPGSNSLDLYHFHVDFTTPSNTKLSGPATIAVAPYTPGSKDMTVALAQPGTTQLLDVNGSDLMHRLAYRNFATANPPYQSLVVTHSVIVGTGASARTGVRWYEIRNPQTKPAVYQQGTYSPNNTNRWMGSVAMDMMGNMAIGYTAGSATTYPSVRYTGRLVTDPLNTMETEATIFAGSGSQTVGGRWGDYSSMSVDPSDDCTMWYTGEYMPATGQLTWATRLFSFKFPTCP
jgi:hypothetical protein